VSASRSVTICNQRGLHARASVRFLNEAANYDAEVSVARDGEAVRADSALDLMMLGAGPGACITISAEGPEAAAAVDALADLVERRFDEDS